LIKTVSVIILLIITLNICLIVNAQRPKPPIADKTIVVMLGTGTPGWDPDRSGPATAIVVNGTPYLVDFGPGVVRRAGAPTRKGERVRLPAKQLR
jgi:hypothetical protein